MTPIVCPSCNGRKTAIVHVNRGSQPHTWEELACHRCNGDGVITPEQQRAMEIGESIREARKARYRTLGDMAARIGISAVELSHAENGKLTPKRTEEILWLVMREQEKP